MTASAIPSDREAADDARHVIHPGGFRQNSAPPDSADESSIGRFTVQQYSTRGKNEGLIPVNTLESKA